MSGSAATVFRGLGHGDLVGSCDNFFVEFHDFHLGGILSNSTGKLELFELAVFVDELFGLIVEGASTNIKDSQRLDLLLESLVAVDKVPKGWEKSRRAHVGGFNSTVENDTGFGSNSVEKVSLLGHLLDEAALGEASFLDTRTD